MFPLAATELAYHNRHHADTKPTYLLVVEGLAYHNMGRIGVQLPASSMTVWCYCCEEGLLCGIVSSHLDSSQGLQASGSGTKPPMESESGIRIKGRPVRVCRGFMTAQPGRMTYDAKPSLTLTVHESALVNHGTQTAPRHAGMLGSAQKKLLPPPYMAPEMYIRMSWGLGSEKSLA